MSVKARQGRKQQLELVYKGKRVKSVHIYEQVAAVSMHGKVGGRGGEGEMNYIVLCSVGEERGLGLES